MPVDFARWLSGCYRRTVVYRILGALLLILVTGLPALAWAQRNPVVICVHDDKAFDCSNLPKRPMSSVRVQVVMKAHYVCTVDGQEVACVEVGRTIRAAHPSDDPTVRFCGEPDMEYSEISVVLGSIDGEQLPLEFGCERRGK